MEPPLVSFFVQAYRTEAWIGECLASIFAQCGSFPFEVVVIDDASADATGEVVRSVRDQRLRFVEHSSNAGAIATANEGYAICRGQYIIRLDSDDRLRMDFLQQTVPLLEANPRVGLVYGDVATIDARGQITCPGNMVQRTSPLLGDEFFSLLLSNFIPAPTTLVRAKALHPLLPIPKNLRFLDWYLTTGIAERWHTAYVPSVLADYRLHTTNMHRAMIRDLSGERTIIQILDALFSNSCRTSEKRRWRRRAYAENYLSLADKYFGCEMNRSARRCYLAALRLRPDFIARKGLLRHLAGTLLDRPRYEDLKRLVLRLTS